MKRAIVSVVGISLLACAAFVLWDPHQPHIAPAGAARPASPAMQSDDSITSGAEATRSLPASPAVGAAAAPSRTKAEYLPAEKQFFRNHELDIGAAQESMTGSQFEKDLSMLENQMAQDWEASDMANAYTANIQQQMQKAGLPGGTRRLACGESLCMGSVTSDKTSSYDAWWKEFEQSQLTPHTIGVDYTLRLGNGSVEHRFMFVTDPKIRTYAGRPKI